MGCCAWPIGQLPPGFFGNSFLTVKKDISSALFRIITVFILSRVIFFLLGVRFDIKPLTQTVQLIDPQLLKDHLLESILYLHSQPPLFNLFVGVILKIFPQNYTIVFNILYCLMGIGLSITLFTLMQRLKINIHVATILTMLFVINPAVVLYENWLLYTYPTVLMLTMAALFLHIYITEQKAFHGFLFFLLLTCLGLTKSIFHVSWIFLFLALLIMYRKYQWKKILMICSIPLIIIFSVYVKNYYLFGTFTLSKVIMGNALMNMSILHTPTNKVKKLYMDGKISIFTAINFYTPSEVKKENLNEKFKSELKRIVNTAESAMRIVPIKTMEDFSEEGDVEKLNKEGRMKFLKRLVITLQELIREQKSDQKNQNKTAMIKASWIPVLDQITNPTTGTPNWNNLELLIVTKEIIKDSFTIVKHYPKGYIMSLKRAYEVYFFPGPTDVTFTNRKFIEGYENYYNFMFTRLNKINSCELYNIILLKWRSYYSIKWDFISLILYLCVVGFYAYLIIFGLYILIKSYYKKSNDLAFHFTLLFLIVNIFYVTMASNAFAWIGSNRYRFIVDPFYLILLGLMLTFIINKVAKKKLEAGVI